MHSELEATVVQALVKLGWTQGRAKELACEARQSLGSAQESDAGAWLKEANQIGLVRTR